jgi:predicted CopG family antitoxin
VYVQTYVHLVGHVGKNNNHQNRSVQKAVNHQEEDEIFSELFERLVENKNPLETLTKLRASVEFEEREKMMSEISASRTEHTVWL